MSMGLNERARSRQTDAVRGGVQRTDFYETSEPLFLTSGFVYDTAADAEAAFNGDVDRFVYARYGNPTTAAFEERLRLIEGAEACTATSTGMAAVSTALFAQLKPGDRLVAARSLFGSCFAMCNEILPKWGVQTIFVDGDSPSQWEEALTVPTAAVFFETPSNPMQTLVDIEHVAANAHAAGASVIVDAGFVPVGTQDAFGLGADVVVYSGTKTMDGQGRVMGGAILGSSEFIKGEVRTLMRHTGPALAPFNAWVLLKGLETVELRSRCASESARQIAEVLSAHRCIDWVRYPQHPSHPQHELARRQMTAGGTVVTFSVSALGDFAKPAVFRLLDSLQVIDISNNFGDAKSLITHPATTTHHAMGPEGRAAIGLDDSVVRLSVGLEALPDLLEDLEQALSRV